MATSSASSQHVQKYSSGSDEDPQLQVMDIRKRKRMLSNRESARRSRQRKQQHLDDLTAQVNQLKTQNGQILASTNTTTQLYLNVEAENAILRAQLDELTNRLQSLNDIVRCLNSTSTSTSNTTTIECDDRDSFCSFDLEFDDFSMNHWGSSLFSNYPIMPTLDAFIC